MTESSEQLATPSQEVETVKADSQIVKELVQKVLREGSDEALVKLSEMPREALIEAAWQGIANYHGPLKAGRIYGSVAALAYDRMFEAEKDFRLSLLTDEERELAISKANDWLDDQFAD